MSAPAVATFKLRRGRVTPTQASALVRLWPQFGVAVDGCALDVDARFERVAPVVLEIGFGMGEATCRMAVASPELNLLAVDVHTPGIGNLLKLIEAHELTNVRVADGDAMILLRHMLAPGSLTAVRIFFPDPWPKTRHAKRRLLTPTFCDLVGDRLALAGVLHIATDSVSYARHASTILTGHPSFEVLPEEEVPPRPVTRYEQQALDAGRPSFDLVARRRS